MKICDISQMLQEPFNSWIVVKQRFDSLSLAKEFKRWIDQQSNMRNAEIIDHGSWYELINQQHVYLFECEGDELNQLLQRYRAEIEHCEEYEMFILRKARSTHIIEQGWSSI